MKRRIHALVLLVVGLTALPSPAAAQDPLKALPEQTAVVVRIASVDRMVGNFNDMIGAIAPQGAFPRPPLEAGLGEVLGVGQKLDAIDRTAAAYAAVFALGGRTEPVARFVKTPDETMLRRAVLRAGDDEQLNVEKRDDGFEKVSTENRTAYFRRHGDWVVFTVNEAVVPLLTFSRDTEKSFADALEPRAAELLASGAAGAAVNVSYLTETFRDPINSARQQLLDGIQQLPDEALTAGGADPEAAKAMYSGLANLAFDTLFDTGWAAGSVDLSAQGLSAEGMLSVKADSGTDVLLAANPPSDMALLEVLPAAAPAYFGANLDVQYIMRWYQGFLGSMLAGDAQQAKALGEAVKQFEQAGLGQIAGSFTLPSDANTGMRTSMLFEAEHVGRLRDAFRAFNTAFKEVKTPLFTQKLEFQAEAESYKDRPVDLATQRMEFATDENPQLAVAQGMISRFFGPEGLQTRLIALEGVMAQASGNNPAYLQRLVDGVESGEGVAGLNEAFSATRDQLGQESNLVVLADVPNLITGVVAMLREVPPFNMILQNLPFNFAAQPPTSYTGFSIGTESRGLRAHLFVPIGQPKGIFQIFGRGS